MDDGIKLVAAALTGWALLQSLQSSGPRTPPSMGPFKAVSEAEEPSFELLWTDAEGRSVFEGPGRTRIVPLPLPEVLRGLSTEWRRYLVDESATRSGTGTTELWVRQKAVLRTSESSTWAFRGGRPVRTLVLHLASKRQIHGVLP